mmetsp:Transcript_16078/g.23817  ORF Transcript_16078/g.23817 Transcript_16078/m.23817 type:complete len:170 (+) Transcript_16078:295-804(+)
MFERSYYTTPPHIFKYVRSREAGLGQARSPALHPDLSIGVVLVAGLGDRWKVGHNFPFAFFLHLVCKVIAAFARLRRVGFHNWVEVILVAVHGGGGRLPRVTSVKSELLGVDGDTIIIFIFIIWFLFLVLFFVFFVVRLLSTAALRANWASWATFQRDLSRNIGGRRAG